MGKRAGLVVVDVADGAVTTGAEAAGVAASGETLEDSSGCNEAEVDVVAGATARSKYERVAGTSA